MKKSTLNHSWIDKSEYPFNSTYIQLSSGEMHYIDEGQGDIMLFIHGTPAWSFLYRNFIKEFSKNHRCIAIDHLGFGLSEKPQDFAGTPQAHTDNLCEFIEKLNLQNITLVVHDFGGPIGLGAAIKNHNRIKQIVLFNSWLWETKNNPAVQKIDKIINSWLGSFLYLRFNFSAKFLFPKGFANKKNITKQLHQQYIHPFPNKNSRYGVLNIGKSLLGSSDWYQAQWEDLGKLSKKPWLIIWGTKDEFITMEYLKKWKKRIPHAIVKELECGHFVQEEEAENSIQAIKHFINQ